MNSWEDRTDPNEQIDTRSVRRAVERSGHSIYWTDTDGTIEYVNPAFEEQTGYTANEAIGSNASILQSGVHDDEFYERLWETICAGEVWEGELINQRKNGDRYVVKQTISPIEDADGEIVRFVAINEEITELRESKEQLERERDRLASILDAIPVPLALVTFEADEAVVNRINRAFEETFGVSQQQLVGSSLDESIVSDDSLDAATNINETLRNGESVRQEVTRATGEGEERIFLLEATPFGEDGNEALGAYIDITDQKRAEAKQRLLTDVSRRIGEADSFAEGLEDTLEAICAYTEWAYGEAWIPDSEQDYLEFACGYTSENMFEAFRAASTSVRFPFGEGLPGRVYTDGSPEWVPDVTKEPDEVFHRRDLADDVGLRAAYGVPLTADDEVVAVMVFFLQEHRERDEELVTDVSDVVASLDGLVARKQYSAQLKEQRDNLETLNQVVRHDIRNNLQLVQGHAKMAEEYIEEDGREYLDIVRESAENAIELTRTARELAEILLQPTVETQEIPFASTLEQQVDEIRAAYPDAVVTIEGGLPQTAVLGNEMLGSVFRNLLQNGIQHNDKEIPRVTVTATTQDDHVEMRITDNGPGIPEAQKEKIFEKGQKGLDSGGTGIGLYLVESLVTDYGGEVTLEDNDPEGTIFVVKMPIAK